jgi:hypothetical protein
MCPAFFTKKSNNPKLGISIDVWFELAKIIPIIIAEGIQRNILSNGDKCVKLERKESFICQIIM